MTMHKEDALQEILGIAKRNDLTLADITRAFTQGGSPEELQKSSGGVLKRIFGYFGGIFILSGIGAFITMHWDEFNSAARIIVTLGTGFAAFIMALAASSDPRYQRAATPLFLIAALLQPCGIFVMLHEFSQGGNPKHGVLFMATVMLLQQGLTLWKKQYTTLAYTTIFFGCVFFGTAFNLMGMDEGFTALVMGTSLMCVTYAVGKTRHQPITPFWYFIASVCLFGGFFDLVHNSPLEILYLGLCAGMVYLSTMLRSRSLLLTSTIAMLSYIGYFTSKHFMTNDSWPIVLVLIGVIFLGLGSLAMKINNKYIKQKG